MSEQDVEKAIQFFSLLRQNRLIFEQKEFLSRKIERANQPVNHTFKP